MIIECPYCEARVESKFIAAHEMSPTDDDPLPGRTVFLSCSNCKSSLLGIQEGDFDSDGNFYWTAPVRLWPAPDRHVGIEIPSGIRKSLEEARRCFKAKSYKACAVMCGSALEGVCKTYNTNEKFLAAGLRELLEKKIIDKRLFQWGETLREHRNIGAHASEEDVSREDAQDLLTFIEAICDYIFVLSEKYNEFMERKQKKVKSKK